MIKLKHGFKDRCDIHQLLDDCYLINTFCSRLEQQAKERATQNGHIIENSDRQQFINKFKGDGLEILVEFLLRDSSHVHNVCIQDYQIIPSDDDTGADGRGVSTINKNPMTVQVKYRQANYILTANEDHLSNFLNASIFKYDVKQEDTHNMIIITTGDGIHYKTETNMLYGKVRTYARKDLRSWVDNKISWWDEFKKSLIHSRTQTTETKKISLRPHQQEAVNAVLAAIDAGEMNGKVVLPTGTGKTLIQAAIIAERIKRGGKIFAIFSPRIILSFQLLKSVAAYLQGEGINATYLNVNSGNFNDEEINEAQMKAGFLASPIESTTSPTKIANEANRAFNLDTPLIISSTYHSAIQLKESGIKIDLQLNDEAHWLVSREFEKFSNVGGKSFSFTATPKETDDESGRGMQNTIKFGNEVFKKTPKEMIEAGEMLPPALHYVCMDNNKHSNHHGELFDCVAQTFERHAAQLQHKSRCPDEIGAKLLVALPGQETLEGILKSVECQAYQHSNPDVNIVAMSSDVGSYINGEQTKNNSKLAFEKIRSMGTTEKAIIFHVDMLSEGIDAPGITAFMPLKGMGDSRFVQGVGRACRLSAADRQDFYNGVLKPSQRNAYIKPYAYVIIPDLTIGCEDSKERYGRLIYQIIDEYGLDYEHIIVEDDGNKPDNKIEDPNNLSQRRSKKFSAADFRSLCHTIKEDLDRPIDIHELALIDLQNRFSIIIEEEE